MDQEEIKNSGSLRFLVIQLRQLGDILLTTPVVSALRKKFPNAQIDFLSHKMGKLVLENNDEISNTFYYSENDGIREQLRLIKHLRLQHYDYCLDFMSNPRSCLWTSLVAPKRSIGFDVGLRSLVFNKRIKRPDLTNIEYIVATKFRLLEEFDIRPSKQFLPRMILKKEDELFANSFLDQLRINTSNPKIIIAATHRRIPRRWPGIHFAKLADNLQTEFPNSAIIWTWGPGELDFVKSVQALCKNAQKQYLTPPTTLMQMAAIMKAADLVIANSNGPSHVAIAMNTKSIQLHGPTKGANWCPPQHHLHSYIDAPNGDLSQLPVKNVFELCAQKILGLG